MNAVLKTETIAIETAAPLRRLSMAIAGQQNRLAVELAVRTEGRIKTVPFTIQTKPVFDRYRRSVVLASGRYAMLDDGMGFSLVPWKPMIVPRLVIEPRLGQTISAVVHGGGVSWKFGRQRGPAIG